MHILLSVRVHGETDSPADRHKAKHKRQIRRDGECHKQTERQVKEDRESHRHTAGRWRSLRAPGQPYDEDSGDRNQRSPCYVRIVMKRRMGWLVKGEGGVDRQERWSERERGRGKNQLVSQKEGKESK